MLPILRLVAEHANLGAERMMGRSVVAEPEARVMRKGDVIANPEFQGSIREALAYVWKRAPEDRAKLTISTVYGFFTSEDIEALREDADG
jgi:hypothetical protein